VRIPGIHHVTAIAGDPQPNVDFYAGVLGLRMVKQTVNFDDPSTYHLYYGDSAGTPGTLLTFFPYGSTGTLRGRRGTGQTVAVSFAAAKESLPDWRHRLEARGIRVEGSLERFGEPYLAFEDPDGMALEIIGTKAGGQHLTGFHSVTLAESALEATASLLIEQFGYRQTGSDGDRTRYETLGEAPARIVDILKQPGVRRGSVARGSVHHVAFRAADAEEQLAWRSALTEAGQEVTPVMEREYFESIYFREPGGVLFEIATDPPGFAIDEAPGELGLALKLPPWLEPQRARIEAVLPKLRIPEQAQHAI
jgi:catechol 2,3-dioxygenase-like lactoylglutathione lyase family enzyme